MAKNNKQIIIDGVDVKDCKIFCNTFGNSFCNPTDDIREAMNCNDYPNCLYKQLKRKEQECEQHKTELEHVKGLLTTSNKLNQALLNVRDELKRELEVAKGLAEIRHQCLEAVKELANNANLPNISLYIDSFLNEEPQNKRGGRC